MKCVISDESLEEAQRRNIKFPFSPEKRLVRQLSGEGKEMFLICA
jgi:hypothetical protein